MRKPVGLRLVGAMLGMVLASVAFGEQPTFMPAPRPGTRRVPPPPKGDVPPSVDADEPTTPTTGVPPTPPTTGQPPTPPTTSQPPTNPETEAGPVTMFGPKNPLALRYLSKFPPVVHVKNPDGDGSGAWTAYVDGRGIKMVKGLHGKPFITFTVTSDQINQANTLGGSPTIENKVELVKLFSMNSEKPFGPEPDGTPLKQPKLTPIERKLMQLGQLSKRSRYLFKKADAAQNQVEKIFWGLQIKIISIWVDKINEHILNHIWEELDGEMDRGQVDLVPGKFFDVFLSVAGVFLMYHDDDLSAFRVLAVSIDKRLKAEMQSAETDYPADQAAQRKAVIQKRMDVNGAILDLINNG